MNFKSYCYERLQLWKPKNTKGGTYGEWMIYIHLNEITSKRMHGNTLKGQNRSKCLVHKDAPLLNPSSTINTKVLNQPTRKDSRESILNPHLEDLSLSRPYKVSIQLIKCSTWIQIPFNSPKIKCFYQYSSRYKYFTQFPNRISVHLQAKYSKTCYTIHSTLNVCKISLIYFTVELK